ncbi:hypothetical protein T03_9212, partial [Trichinella britovi]
LFSFHAGHHAKLCSHQFVLNVASQTSVSVEFAPDCSWIQCTQCKCAHFIHDSITLTSSEYDVSSDGALSLCSDVTQCRFIYHKSKKELIITLRQSSSAGVRIDPASVRFQYYEACNDANQCLPQPNTLNHYNQYVARQTGILFLIAMDYVNIIREFPFSRTLKLRFLRFGCLSLSH